MYPVFKAGVKPVTQTAIFRQVYRIGIVRAVDMVHAVARLCVAIAEHRIKLLAVVCHHHYIVIGYSLFIFDLQINTIHHINLISD